MYALFWLNFVCYVCASRQLYQSQCVFRHGARAPSKWIIPPYDQLFKDTYDANPADLTTEGILQLKAFGSYLRTKYLNQSAYFFSTEYNMDRNYVSVSTSNTPRTHQSVQSLISTLYDNDQYAQIYTLPLSDDLLRVSESCLNFNAELNFQETNSANYSQYLFNQTDNDLLFPLLETFPIFQTNPNLTCEDMGANCYLLLMDQYQSISFHFENETVNDNNALDILEMYHTKLEQLARFNAYKPYTSDAQNIGFQLLNEIINHLDCSIINFLSEVPCSNANNQPFEQKCSAGFCGLVLYSAHDSTLRSLAHQMGILDEFNDFNSVPYGASICFDSYRENDNAQTVDVWYGYPVKDDNSQFGYHYEQHSMGKVSNINDKNNLFQTCINTIGCKLSDIISYRNSRIPTNYGCCNIEGHAKEYFDFVGCSNFKMTTDEITQMNGGYDTCSPYRKLCPVTACGDIDNGLIYAPSLQKCVAMEIEVFPDFSTTDLDEKDKRDCENDNDQWFIIGLVFIVLFAVCLIILVYFGYILYCKGAKGRKSEFTKVKQTEAVQLHETI